MEDPELEPLEKAGMRAESQQKSPSALVVMDNVWLVVWNMSYDFPETVGDVIIPIDFHSIIFQKGWNHQPATRSSLIIINHH